ncbi:MAG: NnrS family protein [Acetobacteraceae bacterium]|nr:NnrS family protein [Acetobacteraceae bacterium]
MPHMPTRNANLAAASSRLPMVFAAGFRPMFLAAGVWARLAALAWVVVFATGFWPEDGLSPTLWHAHEMLFGFAGAAVAGFLLTAVPNWTGRIGYGGPPLVALVAIWVPGRLAMIAYLMAIGRSLLDRELIRAGLTGHPTKCCRTPMTRYEPPHANDGPRPSARRAGPGLRWSDPALSAAGKH